MNQAKLFTEQYINKKKRTYTQKEKKTQFQVEWLENCN